METLQEIKEDYAQEQGFHDWEGLQSDCRHLSGKMESHMDKICIRAQKVALEKAAESLQQCSCSFYNDYQSQKKQITNPENLIR